jgi:hypothetical protein
MSGIFIPVRRCRTRPGFVPPTKDQGGWFHHHPPYPLHGGLWVPGGRKQTFSPLMPVNWGYPSLKCRRKSARGVRPMRADHHNLWLSLPFDRPKARALLRQLSGCRFCGRPLYSTVVLEVSVASGCKIIASLTSQDNLSDCPIRCRNPSRAWRDFLCRGHRYLTQYR